MTGKQKILVIIGVILVFGVAGYGVYLERQRSGPTTLVVEANRVELFCVWKGVETGQACKFLLRAVVQEHRSGPIIVKRDDVIAVEIEDSRFNLYVNEPEVSCPEVGRGNRVQLCNHTINQQTIVLVVREMMNEDDLPEFIGITR